MAAKKEQPTITPQQAHYVIQRLLAARALSHGEIGRYLAGLTDEVRSIEQRLAKLRLAGGVSPAAKTGSPAQRSRRKVDKGKRKSAGDTATVASQKLQGSYIGYVRQFPKAERGKYSAIAKEKGREAAIKRMRADLGR